LDSDCACRYSELAARYESSGNTVRVEDVQIAAICRGRGAALATRNLKHFADAGIELVNPWDP